MKEKSADCGGVNLEEIARKLLHKPFQINDLSPKFTYVNRFVGELEIG